MDPLKIHVPGTWLRLSKDETGVTVEFVQRGGDDFLTIDADLFRDLVNSPAVLSALADHADTIRTWLAPAPQASPFAKDNAPQLEQPPAPALGPFPKQTDLVCQRCLKPGLTQLGAMHTQCPHCKLVWRG